nr:hypothetical protein [Tanacetum cinerariifolium]
MSSLFADTHNVVAILEKSDAAEGFDQVIDFLSGSYIHYALTVNPRIYISCIKQFWNTASVKRSGDVTRLQALVDKKKIVISEGVIREIVQLDDAEGVVCLPNEEIFAGLAQMGYEKPSTKLTVGKGFSGVETPLFEENVVGDVAHDALPSPPSHAIPSPSQEPSSPSQQPQRVESLENDNAAQKLVIIKLKARVKKLEMANKDADIAESEGRHATEQGERQAEIYHIDLDHSFKVLISATSVTIPAASATIPAAKPSIPDAALTVVTAYIRRRKGVIIRDPEEELSSRTPAETPKVKDKGKGIMVETPKPMKKKDQIELDAEYARKLHEEINRNHDDFNKDIDWDAAMDHVNQKSDNPQYIKRYQGIKKRPKTKSEARKNMMIYLKNTAGYKMDFFKGMTYAQICPIFQARFDENMRFLFKSREEMEEEDQEIIKSINETLAQKAAKRRKLSEEAEDLRKRLEVVDHDVFIEATPLARKVPVVDYQIVLKFVDEIDELRAISGHVLGAARVQIPENNLDNLQSSIEEDGTLKTVDPQDLLGCDPLALVGKFTPVEDNIGLLETTFDEDAVLMGVFLDEVTGSVNLTFLVLFIEVTAISLSPKSLIQGKDCAQIAKNQ